MGKMMDRSKRFFARQAFKTFKEAFPNIKKITFKYSFQFGIGEDIMTEETIEGIIPCPNSLCNDGGFEVDRELSREVFSKKLTHHEGVITCPGHEHMGSRWKTRSCSHWINYIVDVEYKK